MAKFTSKYSGKEIDAAIDEFKKQQELSTDKIIDTSVDEPIDLNNMVENEGKYTVYHFSGAAEGTESGKPIEIEVFKYPDGNTGQRYEQNGVTVERKYNSETEEWGEWNPVKDFGVVEGDEVLDVQKDTVVYRVVADASAITPVS